MRVFHIALKRGYFTRQLHPEDYNSAIHRTAVPAAADAMRLEQ